MKTVDEIYGELAAAFAGATGQTAGQDGDMAVRLYAVAAQVYALYVQADWTARQCFPQTFLTIYKLTGPNRYTRSRMGDRFTLTADENTIYSAELKTDAWDCGLDAAGVQELFKQSTTDW